MAYTDNKITAPVSMSDVQAAIGNSSNDLATLCQSPTIRTWAKYKPIEYKPSTQKIVDPLTEAQRQSVNYGIANIPVWRNGKTIGNVINFWLGIDTSRTNRPNDYESNLQTTWWTWLKPTTAFRLTDFSEYPVPSSGKKGYFAGASAPIGKLLDDLIYVGSDGYVTILFSSGLEGITAGLTVTYGDLSVMTGQSYQNLYFGVLIYAGTSVYLATHYNTVGDLSTESATFWSIGPVVRFGISSSASDALNYAAQHQTDVKVFPILSSVRACYDSYMVSNPQRIPTVNTNTTGTFIALQDAEIFNMDVTYAQAQFTAIYVYTVQSTRDRIINWKIELRSTEDVNLDYKLVIHFQGNDGLDMFTRTVTGTMTSRTAIVTGNYNCLRGENIHAYDIYQAYATTEVTGDRVFKKSAVSELVRRTEGEPQPQPQN